MEEIQLLASEKIDFRFWENENTEYQLSDGLVGLWDYVTTAAILVLKALNKTIYT